MVHDRRGRLVRLTALSVFSALFVACGGGGGDGGGGGTSIRPEGSEKPYNASPVSYSGSTVTVTSRAQFKRFDDYHPASEVTSGCGSASNPCKRGLVNTSVRDIRHAEVHIYNRSTGALVQAGETDANGGISMVLPQAAGAYRLEVHSRSDNAHYKASVLNNPYDKGFYKMSVQFDLTGSESGSVPVTLPVAPHNGTLEGAAFNILDNILIANEFLRAHAKSNSSQPDYCPSSVCDPAEDFTVAPKVTIYWSSGLTPAAYYGDPTVPISFYVPQSGGGIYQGLYILGGVEGDICQDTDHYDNSIILHEYGHFLEHILAQSDSPGGSHNGNKVIDPRLAWSEGWANFFQAAALGRTFYRDTTRNAECPNVDVVPGASTEFHTARLSFTDFSMEAQSIDFPISMGEGNFREISIARALYDTMTGSSQSPPYNSNTDSSAADLGFPIIWKSFRGLASSGYHHRNISQLHAQIYSRLTDLGLTIPNAWVDERTSGASADAVLNKEKHRRDSRDYGHLLTRVTASSGSCTGSPNSAWHPWTVTKDAPVKDEIQNGYIVWSDNFNTNDFHLYYYDGTSARASVRLVYRKDPGFSNASFPDPWDLDLYVYRAGYIHLNGSDILKRSENYYPETGSTSGSYPGREVVNLSGLPAGYYLLNIKVDYAGSAATRKADTQYYLELGNGEQLCP